MKKLEPLEVKKLSTLTSINLSPELMKQLDMEKMRVNARSRSELVRLILEAYFAEEE